MDALTQANKSNLEAPGAGFLRRDREEAVASARAVINGQYKYDDPVRVARYLLRTLGVSS